MNKQPFAVFDIDGTLIRWQLYHAVSDALVRLGYFDKDLFEEVRTARMAWKRRSGEDAFKTYENQLISAYHHVLTNLTPAQFNEAVEAVFEEYKDQVYRYTRDLIQELKGKGYLLFAISGSMGEIVGKIAEHYGFDDFVGTEYEQKSGRFTGKLTAHIGTKHVVLKQLAKKHNATWEGSVAAGDSEGDITMLAAVERPIAFNPTKKLFAEAVAQGWKVVVERKNMIYELESSDGTYVLAQTDD